MSDFSHEVDEEVAVEIRRNGAGSVLAYADREHAEEAFDNHREVLRSLYDLVDRRHGSNGEKVARLEVVDDGIGEILVREEFVREIGTDRALALADDMRHYAARPEESRELVTDGGEVEQTDPVTALTDAIDKHLDEDDQCGAPVGRVVEEMLNDRTIDLGDVSHALKEAYFHGVVYQPSPSTVARVATDGGVSHRAECPECSWTGDSETLSGAAREVDEHREETGHDAKVERVIPDGGSRVSSQKIEFVARKWSIPTYEAERMLKNQMVGEDRD